MKNIFSRHSFLFTALIVGTFVGNFDIAFAVHAHYTPTTVMTFGNTPGVQIQTQSITRTHTTDTVLPSVMPSIEISSSVASTTATTTPIVVNIGVQFTKDLYFGITDSEVTLLQKYLNTHGFMVSQSGFGSLGNESNYFGKATKASLIKFQKANGIKPALGYFGPITQAFVNSH